MTSLQRFVIVPRLPAVGASTLWRAVLVVMALWALLIARACGYQFGTVVGYFAYLALYIVLPGGVVLYAVNRGRVSLAWLIALGVPTGFAVEIFTFLGLAAVGLKSLYVATPVFWALMAVGIRLRRGKWPVRVRLSANHAGIVLGLGFAFLVTALMAASQMFAESPLADGLPTRAIFHDWVYLVSRAAVIKNNWPLDDPSLSGTPLQYHYFMMVHAAAVSWTSDIEISAVMLRLVFLPLGGVLVMQAFILGRIVSRSPWGGVMAALLTVMVSEVSFQRSYGDPLFLGLFARWLFVSPTFFFGMIFCGALLIAVGTCARRTRCGVRHYLWLLLLGTATTGAKGTVVPVLVCALVIWAAWRWRRERRLPTRLVLFAGGLTFAFAVVYIPTMLAWRTGDAALRPFHVFHLTGFWKEYFPAWTRWMAQWLPRDVAVVVASMGCAAVVLAGTCGVRLLAIPYLVWGEPGKRDLHFVGWIGAFAFASAGMGMLLELNSYGELYLILMMRLPTAVLTAAFFVSATRRIVGWWRESQIAPGAGSHSPFATRELDRREPGRSAWLSRLLVGSTAAVLLVTLGLQTSLSWTRNREGFAEWLKTPTDLKPDDYMRELQEALLWVRTNTAPNAVLVANACTPENMKKDHWGALDRTLTGVHFYYSALSERRLWFEGPNYILDTTRARIRANLASGFFYRNRALSPALVSDGPSYALIDHSLTDGAAVSLPGEQRVFANSRIEIYRLSTEAEVAEPGVGAGDAP